MRAVSLARYFSCVRMHALLLLLLLMLSSRDASAFRAVRSSTQRPLFASLPQLHAADLDGDGSDEWILTEVRHAQVMHIVSIRFIRPLTFVPAFVVCIFTCRMAHYLS